MENSRFLFTPEDVREEARNAVLSAAEGKAIAGVAMNMFAVDIVTLSGIAVGSRDEIRTDYSNFGGGRSKKKVWRAVESSGLWGAGACLAKIVKMWGGRGLDS